jgi:GH25 family lysozyme M1 (1,4-beta-N-acetylmuramidase)
MQPAWLPDPRRHRVATAPVLRYVVQQFMGVGQHLGEGQVVVDVFNGGGDRGRESPICGWPFDTESNAAR